MSPTEINLDGERYLHVKAAASVAGVVSDYMARLCRNGAVRGLRLGGVWHAQESSLTAFIIERDRRKTERRKELAELRASEQRALAQRLHGALLT